MKYHNIVKGIFRSRPNRFIAYVEIEGKEEKVHVKNTGRCRELLVEGATVYLEKSDNPDRSTGYDLVKVIKNGQIINMDSQAPNLAAKEWLLSGGLFPDMEIVKPETTYGDSRFDFYFETKSGKKAFMEVKGVTLEENGIASFPDAPSDRAVKHIYELIKARKDGYEAFLLFVVQMKHITYVRPNRKTHPEFADALWEAKKAGVTILAYDCEVTETDMEISSPLPVYISPLQQISKPLLEWYDKGHRILPWRESPTPYHVWVSEIMLQQTRVEAVKPYYDRFMKELPGIKDLAEAEEERLLKLWEGLGYYNRVRNLQKTAKIIMEEYGGEMPASPDLLCGLPGIGNYTAAAISSIAFNRHAAAVDGNVLRVISRVQKDDRNILDNKIKSAIEQDLYHAMSGADLYQAQGTCNHEGNVRYGDFNQAMMELGATVCVPNGAPKCDSCPLNKMCLAHQDKTEMNYPYKEKKKPRSIEEKTVLILQDDGKIALVKRPEKGLLAGMYEFPCIDGKQTRKYVLEYLKELGFSSIRIKNAGEAKHIFSHKEWHMVGYAIQVDELSETEKAAKDRGFVFADKIEIEERYPLPSAYAAYMKYLQIKRKTSD